MSDLIDCKTVGELIEALSRFPKDAVPMSASPPFTGVRLVPQNTGQVLIVEPRPRTVTETVGCSLSA